MMRLFAGGDARQNLVRDRMNQRNIGISRIQHDDGILTAAAEASWPASLLADAARASD